MIIINNEQHEVLIYPLESYFSQKGISSEDIPWLDKTFNLREYINTSLYRGYRATWLIENDSIFLIKIENGNYRNRKKGSKSPDADLKAMFGTKYKNGKVFADWINKNLFIQLGFFINRFYPTIQSMEVKYTVSKVVVQSINQYSALTGESTPDVIRIWTGKKLDTEGAKDKIYTIVNKNFRWSKEMTENRDLSVLVTIGKNFSNTVLSLKQNELKITDEVLDVYLKRKKNLERKDPLEETDKSDMEYLDERITKLEKLLSRIKESVEEENKKNKPYLDELARILKPLKIETVLFRGKPDIFRNFQLHFRMDAKNKTITKDASKKTYP